MSVLNSNYSRKEAYEHAKTVIKLFSSYKIHCTELSFIDIPFICGMITQSRYHQDRDISKININNLHENAAKKMRSDRFRFYTTHLDSLPSIETRNVLIAGFRPSVHNWKLCKHIYLNLLTHDIQTRLIDSSCITFDLSHNFPLPIHILEEVIAIYDSFINIANHFLHYPNHAAFLVIENVIQIYLNRKRWVEFMLASDTKLILSTVRITPTLQTIYVAAFLLGIPTIEIMHGSGIPNNIIYQHKVVSPFTFLGKHLQFPDIICTSRKRTSDIIAQTWCDKTLQHHKVVHITGHDDQWDVDNNQDLNANTSHHKLKVLIVGQWGGSQKDRLELLLHPDLNSYAQDELIHFAFRPHPLSIPEDRDLLQQHSLQSSICIQYNFQHNQYNCSVNSSISQADIVIGQFSTLLLDSASRAKYVFSYGKTAREMFSDLLNINSFFNFHSADDIVEFVIAHGLEISSFNLVKPHELDDDVLSHITVVDVVKQVLSQRF